MTGAAPTPQRPVRRIRPPRDEGAELPIEVVRFATLPRERQELLLHVSGLVDGISHGTVVMVLQDRQVVQVELSEKLRLR